MDDTIAQLTPPPAAQAHEASTKLKTVFINSDSQKGFGMSLELIPEDVLIEIFTWVLEPPDIVAVSHTNRALRLLSNLDIIWRCALLRWVKPDQKDFPLICSPTLDLTLVSPIFGDDGYFSTECETFNANSLPLSASLVRMDSIHPMTQRSSERSTVFESTQIDSPLPLGDLYWRTLRIQWSLMRQSRPIMELVASISPKRLGPPDETRLIGITLSARGEILSLWFHSGEVHLIDMRPSDQLWQQYVLRIDMKVSLRNEEPNIHVHNCVEPFVYLGKQGLLVVYA
ncbi:hypothetical protein DL93DRAFT_2168676 [Clavulina sp. PMI_390]|nr:hypothetical protein DL93DRAFT_2168676 [Clavulina sp. PMI_390]